MVSIMIINKALHLIQVRRDRMESKKVCRVYKPTEQVPCNILHEVIPGTDIFKDKVTKEYFKYTKEGMVAL